MCRRRLCVFLGIIFCALADARPADADPATRASSNAADDSSDAFLTTLYRVRDLLLSTASPEDALAIRGVSIHVAPDLIRAHGAASFVTRQGRDIFVAHSLPYELSLAAEAQYVEHAFGVPDLM